MGTTALSAAQHALSGATLRAQAQANCLISLHDNHGFRSKLSRALAICALSLALAVEAAPTLTYYSGGVETTKSSWTSDASDATAGWAYDLKALDTDTLTLSGPGPYKLSGSVSSDFSVIVAGSCTVTLEGYSVSDSQSPIVVSDGATLTLLIGEGTSTLAGASTATHGNHPGIEVQAGGTLVIDKVEGKYDAECILSATGGLDCAAIGGRENSNCGDIVINGGTVNATGGNEAAGIGGGNITSGSVTIGTITINGGVVTATGKGYGAGIGTGLVEFGATATLEGINITGGKVTATGASGGAGIGAGEVYDAALQSSKTTVDAIEISGGSVTATGGDGAAGIGTGTARGSHVETDVSNISISGGTVTARKGDNASGDDIGRATSSHSTGTTTMGAVTVTGGSIAAGTTLTNPSSGSSGNLQTLTISGNWQEGEMVEIAGLDDYGTNDIFADESGNIILLVPDGTYIFSANGLLYEATVSGGDSTARFVSEGGAAWLDSASQLSWNSIRPDGENISITFSVTLFAGADFATWVQLSLASGKVAVVLTEDPEAIESASLDTLIGGGTVEGVSLIYVGTGVCSSTAAEYVSSDAETKTMTIRAPKPSQNVGFFRICVL